MFDKLLNVLSKNLGYTIVLAVSIILFIIFSGGLISGLITAVSVMLGYTCVMALVAEYKKVQVKAVTKKAPAKKKK